MKYNLYSDELHDSCLYDPTMRGLTQEVGSWRKAIVAAIDKQLVPSDHGTMQFFFDQWFLKHSKRAYKVKPNSKLSGFDNIMEWPEDLPATVMITTSPKIRFSGVPVPNIMVGTNMAGFGFQEIVDDVMEDEGLPCLIKAPEPGMPVITVNYIDPHENHVTGSRIMTYLSPLHFTVLQAAENFDEYRQGMEMKGQPLNIQEDRRMDVMFQVHQLVLSVLTELRTNKRNVIFPRSATIGGTRINLREMTL